VSGSAARSPRRTARSPRRVVVTAHAKLNLGLAIGPVRADGYHDLASIFQSISLADTLTAERTARGFSLRVRRESVAVRGAAASAAAEAIPAGAENLVLRAARLAAERLGLRGGARFQLTKRIPAQAGMGGGSADAAAALMAMAALHGVSLTRAQKIALALELGSDVPFAITGGTAYGRGRGEDLRPLRLAAPFRAIVAMPEWRISTAQAFRRFDHVNYDLTGRPHETRFTSILRRERLNPLHASGLGNSFEAVLGPRQVSFESLCARLRAAGLLEPRLTGSGSGVFGIVPARATLAAITGRFLGDEPLYAVRSVGRGLQMDLQS
jgi:4-diphosphocytidyl-2-C-methyl-D-erythritol kinase